MNERDKGKIESYDGPDAFYSGSKEDYESFLKDMDKEEAKTIGVSDKDTLGETKNIQAIFGKIKQKAGETIAKASKKISDEVSAENRKAEKTSSGNDGDFEDISLTLDELKEFISETIQTSYGNEHEHISTDISALKVRFDAYEEKISELILKIDEVEKNVQALEVSYSGKNRDIEGMLSDFKYSSDNIQEGILEIKKGLFGVTKLNDAVFDLKNSQSNTKSSISELVSAVKNLRKKCITGITVLSILSAIIIALQIVQLLSQ